MEEFIVCGKHFVVELHGPLPLWFRESIENCIVKWIGTTQVKSGEVNQTFQGIVQQIVIHFLRLHFSEWYTALIQSPTYNQ